MDFFQVKVFSGWKYFEMHNPTNCEKIIIYVFLF